MPNSRRRRFSVQNDMDSRELSKPQYPITAVSPHKIEQEMTQRPKSKSYQNNSKSFMPSHLSSDSESTVSIITVRKQSNTTLNKHIGVTSSSFNTLDKDSTDMLLTDTAVTITKQISTDLSNTDSQKITTRRNKLPRHHRVKVRSPHIRGNEPMRLINRGTENIFYEKLSTGTDPIIFPPSVEACTTINCNNIMSNDEEDRQSSQSNDDICRICHGGESLNSEQGQLISACACRGTVGRVHVKCLERWLTESGKSRCELCSTRYATKRVHRYGVLKALVMWILSQNAKQLLVDSLGIMLMSPLAVLAAWLSGRTLAGLMMDNHMHMAPWPLASTFVLACLTLVCYYCWIVSAATRHALGWWIWYRSQYEVRLELQESEN